MRGLVVGLDEVGELSLSYLGTDPPTSAVGATETKDLNYEAMDGEHKELLQVRRLIGYLRCTVLCCVLRTLH